MSIRRCVIAVLSFLLGVSCFGQGLSSSNDEPKQVAVFVYCDKSVTTPVSALRARLTSTLVNEVSDSYIVVDRTDEILSALRSEYDYQGSGMVRDDQLMTIGEHLGAYYLCVVSVTYYSDYEQYTFECKLVNVDTRRIEKQSMYPYDEETVVSSLSPQVQFKVGAALSSIFKIETTSSTQAYIYLYGYNNENEYKSCPIRFTNLGRVLDDDVKWGIKWFVDFYSSLGWNKIMVICPRQFSDSILTLLLSYGVQSDGISFTYDSNYDGRGNVRSGQSEAYYVSTNGVPQEHTISDFKYFLEHSHAYSTNRIVLRVIYDNQTGSLRQNVRDSEKIIQMIKRILLQYGFDESCIELVSEGSGNRFYNIPHTYFISVYYDY